MDQEEVRHMAYLIWLSEGRPSGHDREHWQRAEQEYNDLQANGSGQPKITGKKTTRKTVKETDSGTVGVEDSLKPIKRTRKTKL